MNKVLKTILIVITLIVLCVFIFLVVTSVKNKQRREEDKLYSTLNTVVKEFYRDYYYSTVLGSDDNTRKINAEILEDYG